MEIYLNPDNEDFRISCNGKIYVDKSMLIEYTNSILRTSERFICVSRPRRFGKSTDANMLVAYYSKGCDSHELFDSLKISKTEAYEKHLNQHNVIYLNMQEFLSDAKSITEMLDIINNEVVYELLKKYDVDVLRPSLKNYLKKIYNDYKESFIFIIDEWDCIFREYATDEVSQKIYTDFLRNLLKDQKYVSLVYMTGILSIKKFGTQSSLNMFNEISMVNPRLLKKFMGFTEEEVEELCKEYQMSFEEMKAWYGGYHLNDEIAVLSPCSIVSSLLNRKFKNYWTPTEDYESLKMYINMDFEGLKEDIIKLLARKRVIINASKFHNDMTTLKSKDDVFTLLVHLGYLGYDRKTSEVYIPNNEVVESFMNSIEEICC